MGYQTCPVCKGTGKTYDNLADSSFNTCTVCNGGKIISELTGLPPRRPDTNSDPKKLEKLEKFLYGNS